MHRLLREHPAVSGFAETGAPEDEGQHLQSVFEPAYAFGGPGAFVFDPRAHLTETSALVTGQNRDRLLREWGAYYELDRQVWLEKSPPNLVRARFFQALFPDARFLFLVRHPLAVALATMKWRKATAIELVLHWHVAYSIMDTDREYLRRYRVLRYEDLVASPQARLDELCDFAGIERFVPREMVADHNPQYFDLWRRDYGDVAGLLQHVFPSGRGPLQAFGYRFTEPFVHPIKDS